MMMWYSEELGRRPPGSGDGPSAFVKETLGGTRSRLWGLYDKPKSTSMHMDAMSTQSCHPVQTQHAGAGSSRRELLLPLVRMGDKFTCHLLYKIRPCVSWW